MAIKKYVRDRDAKTKSILDSTKRLVEDKRYDEITIRDISKEANVSVGLIYKYFPGGKPEIIREIGLKFVGEITAKEQQQNIDLNDFPGFLRAFFKNNFQYYKDNKRFLAALSIATMIDPSIFEGFEPIGEEKMRQLVKFFENFKGVKLSNKKDAWLFLAKWSDITKSIMLHHTIYPTPFESDDELIELLVKISLMMWDHKPE